MFSRGQKWHSLTFYDRSSVEIPSFQLDRERQDEFLHIFCQNQWLFYTILEKLKLPSRRMPEQTGERVRK